MHATYVQHNLRIWPGVFIGHLAQLATILLNRQIYMILYVVITR